MTTDYADRTDKRGVRSGPEFVQHCHRHTDDVFRGLFVFHRLIRVIRVIRGSSGFCLDELPPQIPAVGLLRKGEQSSEALLHFPLRPLSTTKSSLI